MARMQVRVQVKEIEVECDGDGKDEDEGEIEGEIEADVEGEGEGEDEGEGEGEEQVRMQVRVSGEGTIACGRTKTAASAMRFRSQVVPLSASLYEPPSMPLCRECCESRDALGCSCLCCVAHRMSHTGAPGRAGEGERGGGGGLCDMRRAGGVWAGQV